MAAWLQEAPALFLALAVFTLPGLPAAWILRLRGLTFIAAAIAASISVIAIASVAGPFIGLSWGPSLVGITAAVVTVALSPVRFLTSSPANRGISKQPGTPSSSFTNALLTVGSVGLAGAIIATTLIGAIGAPENFSQTYDGVFHVNAAAHILLTGNASPLHMNLSAPDSVGSFYPTAWHASVALVAQLTGASIPVATNAIGIMSAAVVWPIAILFFSRPFFAKKAAHLAVGAIVAASFTAFPYLFFAWGALYPNLLSTALIPLALGFVYPALRYRATLSRAPLASLWVAAAGASGAAALAHPNALFGIAVFTLPMLLVTVNDIRRQPATHVSKVLRWSGIALVVAFYAALWSVVSTTDNERDTGNLTAAFIDGFSNAPMLDARAWFLSVLVVAGIVLLILRRRHRWLILSYVAAMLLFVCASAIPDPLRSLITGPWYNDAHRLAALLPIAAVPLAAIAASQLLDLVSSGVRTLDIRQATSLGKNFLPVLATVLVMLLIFTGPRGQNLATQTGWISDLHRADGFILSEDERTLLERIPEEVPADAVIGGDPWTGTGLALAISEREVLFGHLNGTYGPTATRIAADFTRLGSDACPLLDELRVGYMLDFGPDRYSIGTDELYEPYSGLVGLQQSPVVKEIDREGDAVLYEVSCD